MSFLTTLTTHYDLFFLYFWFLLYACFCQSINHSHLYFYIHGDVVMITVPPGFDETTEEQPYNTATSQLAFPGMGAEAATVLVER